MDAKAQNHAIDGQQVSDSQLPTLLALPQEILLRILTEILSEPVFLGKIIPHRHSQRFASLSQIYDTNDSARRVRRARLINPLSIFYACRTLNTMAYSLFYSNQVFQIHVECPSTRWTSVDRRRQGSFLAEQGGSIRNLRLFIEVTDARICCKQHLLGHSDYWGILEERVCSTSSIQPLSTEPIKLNPMAYFGRRPLRRLSPTCIRQHCKFQLRQIVKALLWKRTLPIRELTVVSWFDPMFLTSKKEFQEGVASDIMEPTKGLKGQVLQVYSSAPGCEIPPFLLRWLKLSFSHDCLWLTKIFRPLSSEFMLHLFHYNIL
jgi:hypothetical protein